MCDRPTVAQIRELPPAHTGTVTNDLIDENGHMNVRPYFDFQVRAGDSFFSSIGIDSSYPKRTGLGVFTLEQHIVYHSECLPGQDFTVHLRLVSVSKNTVHTISYLVNDSTHLLAHVVENMIAHVDLSSRRISPWPETVFQALDARAKSELDWTPHTTGCLKTR